MGRIPMKKCLTILISFVLLGTTISIAQNVSLNVSQQNLRAVLESLATQAEYTLAFSKEAVDLSEIVTVGVTDVALTEVLNQLLTPRNIGYEIRENKIFIFDKSSPALAQAGQVAQQEQRITGRVTDENGDPVIGPTSLFLKAPLVR